MTDQLFVDSVHAASKAMRHTAIQIVGRQYAEDVVSDAVLNAWRGRATWDATASAKTWLIACARNQALDHLRKARVRPQRTADGETELLHIVNLGDHRPNPEQAAARRESLAIIGVTGDLEDEGGGASSTLRDEARRTIAAVIRTLSPAYRHGFERWLAGDCKGATEKVQALRARRQIIPLVRMRLHLGIDGHPRGLQVNSAGLSPRPFHPRGIFGSESR